VEKRPLALEASSGPLQFAAMREIVFDTETTGLYAEQGDRIIEIGAVELENRFPTGRTLHFYINPVDREIHPDAQRVHGISAEFLADKPPFEKIADAFFDFVSDANLVAHNARFDLGFLNAELARLKKPAFDPLRIVDTLAIARKRHPMGPNSLDALCARYGVDNSNRVKHGALLDAELLAEVYIEMNGGRQASLLLVETEENGQIQDASGGEEMAQALPARRPQPLAPRLDADAIARHEGLVESLGEKAIWLRYRQT
jgi:DNA polymerase-3 subunit epsilon